MSTMILDGYNVIHAVPEMSRRLDRGVQSAREALVRLCQEYQGRRGDIERLYVVFDGRDASASGSLEQHHGGVTVLFTQEPEEADARILRVIESQRGRRCVVVSNDNEVFNNARAFGARVMSVQEFYEQLRPASARRSEPPTTSDKAALSARDAREITKAYWEHLEKKKSPPEDA
ncbi:MAG: NYN domain-containing protein [Candidatus Omnitrophica bacterium]|nr:NYN domain-containing protein [Candidatus Omnitrophota bacterium]MBI3020648.1 NYN domain-containing protein [Candidatus Omnitrophota bacterium]